MAASCNCNIAPVLSLTVPDSCVNSVAAPTTTGWIYTCNGNTGQNGTWTPAGGGQLQLTPGSYILSATLNGSIAISAKWDQGAGNVTFEVSRPSGTQQIVTPITCSGGGD